MVNLDDRHHRTQAKMRFFEYDHLPEHLKVVSEYFYHLAYALLEILPDDSELTVALDKLRESKDRAVALAAIVPASEAPQTSGHDQSHM